MAKKLKKSIEGSVVTIEILQEDGSTVTKVYDTAELPKDIQSHLVPFGAGHKLGDSAAQFSDPEDIEEVIDRVWSQLVAGQWTLKKPAEPKTKAPKVSRKALLENLSNLSESDRAIASEVLAKLGIII